MRIVKTILQTSTAVSPANAIFCAFPDATDEHKGKKKRKPSHYLIQNKGQSQKYEPI
jgi:hypothetical protein